MFWRQPQNSSASFGSNTSPFGMLECTLIPKFSRFLFYEKSTRVDASYHSSSWADNLWDESFWQVRQTDGPQVVQMTDPNEMT